MSPLIGISTQLAKFTDRLKMSRPYSIMQWRLPSVICTIDIYPLPHK